MVERNGEVRLENLYKKVHGDDETSKRLNQENIHVDVVERE